MFKKFFVFIVCLLPVIGVVWLALNNNLGPDPGKEIVLLSGIWALRLLLLTLLLTPLRTYLGWNSAIRYRRMLGLYVWFYASLHFVAVWTYLLGWSWAIFIEEFSERPYMMMGIVAWLLLLPLGLTSNHWSQRQLGRRWKSLHKLVYVIGILACIHFIWLVRSDYTESLVYSLLLVILLVSRSRWCRLGTERLRARLS